MKRFYLTFLAVLIAAPVFGDSHGVPGGVMPSQIEVIGGKDSNGKTQPIATGTDGSLSLSTGVNASTTAATLAQGTKAVTTAGTPVQLLTASTLVESVEIHARKSTTTPNTGNVFVGYTAGVGTQLRVLAPGETFILGAPSGKKIQLNGIYLDSVTNGDGVTYNSVN